MTVGRTYQITALGMRIDAVLALIDDYDHCWFQVGQLQLNFPMAEALQFPEVTHANG